MININAPDVFWVTVLEKGTENDGIPTIRWEGYATTEEYLRWYDDGFTIIV